MHTRQEILWDRYPDLAFLLQFTPFTLCSAKDAERNSARFLHKKSLHAVDVFYLYGIGQGGHYAALKPWLAERKERVLVILEDDLGAIAACLQETCAEEIFKHPQVHVRFFDKATLSSIVQELVNAFASAHIEVASIARYAKKRAYQRLKMLLYRLSAVSHALMTETLYSHKLLSNLLRNMLRWPTSFFANSLKGHFSGIPAIVCGAGPSLAHTFDQLKQMEDRALIIAGGSAISALSNHGIIPHMGIALDPNPEEFERLRAASGFEMPLIYATRLHADVFNTCNGERGYLLSQTGGSCETHFEKMLQIEGEPIGPELGPEAFSVTTIAVALAVEMGCDPIILNGLDLAYTRMQRYAPGVTVSSSICIHKMKQTKQASDRVIKRKDLLGTPTYTLVKWVMESECIAAFAKAHPECRFINATSGGIGFSDIPNQDLPTFEHAPYDLRALLHTLFQMLKITCNRETILQEMHTLHQSLVRMQAIAQEMLQELHHPTGKALVLELDFQEEKAFTCLFPFLGPCLDRLLDRTHCASSALCQEDKQHVQTERQIAKWLHFKQMIEAKTEILHSLFSPISVA